MAEDYKPNSHRSKEQELHEPMPEKRTEKVVTGNVKQRKKSGLAKAGSIFVPVSYTHLTLPTIHPVLISVVAISFNKKRGTRIFRHCTNH